MIKKNMDETTKGFMKHNGGLSLKRVDSSNYEFNVEVKDYHLNSGKFAHGGFLATIADTGMGTAAHQIAENKRCVTINLDIKYIAPAHNGESLLGKIKILKKTKSLVFINCEITNKKELIASASGIWKII